jgi:Domain of unknown function (DU1801)
MRMSKVVDDMSRVMEDIAPDVAAVFAAYPPKLRTKLAELRRLILQTAAATPGVGPLEETLKWGQPSYLTSATKSGTTVRIDRLKGKNERYALFVHCQTDLTETFRELYPDTFRYQGRRAIVFDADDTLDEASLRHCIALALTYHLRKKRQRTRKEGPLSRPLRGSRRGS